MAWAPVSGQVVHFGDDPNGLSITASVPNNFTAGNTIIIAVAGDYSGNVGIANVTGNSGAEKAVRCFGVPNGPNTERTEIWIIEHTAGGFKDIFINFTGSIAFRRISVAEFSGASGKFLYEGFVITAAATSTSFASGSLTPVNNNCLVIGAGQCAGSTVFGSSTFTVDVGFSASGVDNEAIIAHSVQTTAAAANWTAFIGGTVSWAAAIGAFRQTGPSFSPFNIVQANRHDWIAQSDSANNIALTGSVVTAGNTVMGVATCSGNLTVNSILDDKTNSYTIAQNIYDAALNQKIICFYKENITNGPNTITILFNSGTTFKQISWIEVSGIATASALDASNAAAFDTSSSDMATTVTTTVSGDFVFGALIDSGGLPEAHYRPGTTNTPLFIPEEYLGVGSGFNVYGPSTGLGVVVAGAAGSYGVAWQQLRGSGGRALLGTMAFKPAAGGGTATGAGSGTGTGTGVGKALFNAVGAGSGTGTATGAGKSLFNAVGASAGTGTAAATGKALFNAVGAAAGVGTAAAVGNVLFNSVGAASGQGTAAAVGAAIFSAVGAASGTGTANGVSPSPASVGAASGTGTAAGVGAALFSASGAASGTGNAAAAAKALFNAVGAASGIGTANATGAAAAASVGAASGQGTAAGVGAALFSAVGAAVGIGTASGIAEAGISVGAAIGIGTAAGTGKAIFNAVGASTGTGTATATARALVASVGAASGTGTANAVGVNAGVGTGNAVGIGTAAAFSKVIAASVGNAKGIGTAAGAGHQIGTGTQRRPTAGVGAPGRGGAGDIRPASEFAKRPGSENQRRPTA